MRLPKCVIPSLYDLELWTDLETCKFQGELKIHVDILENTSTIVFNIADLILNEESVYLQCSDEIIRPGSSTIDRDNELLVLQFETALPLGKSILCLNYHGSLNEKLDGFYKSTYESGGEKKNMAVTVFEPADCRSCFPCWDEPDFKACFKFKVHAPSDRMVLSNMPSVNEFTTGNTKVVEFQESPPMSTYVVAIVIGEFEYMEGVSEDGILVRVYTAPGELHKGKFGFDIMLKLLPFYGEYFQYRYPLPKLDIVSVPVFKAGALEEFGLIVFRDIALFVDEHTSATKKQEVAINVAHEVAHMWFGNIVTLEWWTHIWLNEGMATWISYMAVNYVFPEWNIWMDFHKEIMYGLMLDACDETHPVEVEVKHGRDTMEVFDAIGYCKGASIIYMLQHYLGLADIQKGLILYTQRFAFGNAKSDDLWDCFHEVTGKPVKELMSSWTKQKGYPVIKATLYDGKLLFEQSQFRANGQVGEGQWIIPITYCSGSYEFNQSMLLKENKCEVSVPSRNVKVNVDQSGFYRVDYDEQLLICFKDSISSGWLNAADRLGVLDDMFALCQAGKQPLSALLLLLGVYQTEVDPSVLSKMVEVALGISSIMSVAIPSLSQKTNSILSKLLEIPARKLGWEVVEGENFLNSIVRESLLHALVVLDHEETIVEAKNRFANNSLVPLSSNILKAAYGSIMKDTTASNRDGYKALLEIYRSSDNVEERENVLGIIGASSDPEMVIEALNFSLSSEVHAQDTSVVFSGIPIKCGSTCWNWLKENWNMVHDKLGEGLLLRRVINHSTSKLWSNDMVDEVREMISSNTSKYKRLANKFSEKVKLSAFWIDWIRKDQAELEQLINI